MYVDDFFSRLSKEKEDCRIRTTSFEDFRSQEPRDSETLPRNGIRRKLGRYKNQSKWTHKKYSITFWNVGLKTRFYTFGPWDEVAEGQKGTKPRRTDTSIP